MRRVPLLLVALVCAAPTGRAEEPKVAAKPDAFPTLVNPACSHCVDEAKRRTGELRDDDPVLCWTRGYSDGGAIPIRFFLSKHRVISDSYGVFVYDPDAGFARGFEASFNFAFHGWRNGVMVVKDSKDGTLYSALSGVGVEGPRKGERLKPVPTLTTTWLEVMGRYPNAVAYQMPRKYEPVPPPKEPNAESVKTRPAKTDPRLKPDELVLGVRVGDKTRAYPLAKLRVGTWVLDEVGGEKVLAFNGMAPLSSAVAYKPVAHQPRKFQAPNPDKNGVSPPDAGEALPDGKEQPPVKLAKFAENNAVMFDEDTGSSWDAAGRAMTGKLKGWTLEPVDFVVCKWFAWAAEYPETEVYPANPERERRGDDKKPDPAAVLREAAGSAELLRLLPKPFATLKAIDLKARTVTLLLDGEKVAKVWPLEPDAEVKVAGFWGRLDQFKPGQRVWAWLKLDRAKNPTSVVMLADERSEQHIHGKLPHADAPDERYDEQVRVMRKKWLDEGLPGTVGVSHVFSGEVEVMIDHEGMRWARSLRKGDIVHVSATPPIKAVVKAATPWRERTQLRLLVGELAASDVKVGTRVFVKMPDPGDVDSAKYPPDIGRGRTKAERVEWFLASTYCVCGVKGDTCTGHFYTLASCNPYGCGAPDATRKRLAAWIDEGKTDTQIWDAMLKEKGGLMTRPHLLP